MQLIYATLFLLFTTASLAQSLSGIVRNSQTNQPLPGVSVRLLPTTEGVLSDARGGFDFGNLPKGTYTLRLSLVGYQTADTTLTLLPRTNQMLNVRLRPTVVQLNEQTVVTTQRTETPDFIRPEFTTVVTPRDLRQQPPRTVARGCRR